jgi:DNA-binding response OmpR family regulator
MLFLEQNLRYQVSDALKSMGIEVSHFAAVDAAISQLQSESFAAILVEDCASHISHWLGSLQAHAAEPIALIVVGSGGAAGMSRALRHGADDYVVIGDGTEQLVHRSIARASAKIQRRHGSVLRLGPYTLDSSHCTLSSVATEVHLSPRELLLARVLFENHGRVVSFDRLSSHLCGRTDDAARRAVKQHAHTLRRKCPVAGGSSGQGLNVESIYGAGYRLTL